MAEQDRKTCTGTRADGGPCGNAPLKGQEACWHHADTGQVKREAKWDREAFLQAFEQTAMVSEACRVVGVGRNTVYMERQRNEDFALRWADIEERTTEMMEREAFRRGTLGVEKPVFQQGQQVGSVREYSDTLLIFMLKSRRPEVYRENVKVDHGGSIEQRVRVELDKLSDKELADLEQIASKLES